MSDGQRKLALAVLSVGWGRFSDDRGIATETVVKTLIEGGALGALSTDDLPLTEIPDSMDGGVG